MERSEFTKTQAALVIDEDLNLEMVLPRTKDMINIPEHVLLIMSLAEALKNNYPEIRTIIEKYTNMESVTLQ